MLWELMKHGSLPHWWEYAGFVALMLVLMIGPVAVWYIWTTRPPRD